jgi:hypothetical protein
MVGNCSERAGLECIYKKSGPSIVCMRKGDGPCLSRVNSPESVKLLVRVYTSVGQCPKRRGYRASEAFPQVPMFSVTVCKGINILVLQHRKITLFSFLGVPIKIDRL